jgi:GntR family transcriptional regulator
MTVHKAFFELEKEGLIYRQPGKGTFVASPKILQNFSLLVGFDQKMAAKGLHTRTKVLSVSIGKPIEKVREALRLSAEDSLFEIVRLRYVEGEPMVLQTVYLPERLFPGLLEKDLSCSLTNIIRNKYGYYLENYFATVEPILPNKQEAQMLRVNSHMPLLRLEGVTYARGNLPVRYTIALYRTDRLKFVIEGYDMQQSMK